MRMTLEQIPLCVTRNAHRCILRRMLFCCVLAFAGASVWVRCDGRAKVLIKGTLTEYGPGDTVYVSLTNNWEQIRKAPESFTIQESGYFELEFTVGRNPPPVTFVKNDGLYAKLILHSFWEQSPVIIDEVRNRTFDVTIDANGQFMANITL